MAITEAVIRTLASAESFQRGEDYYRSDAVIDLQQRGDTLLVQVEGSSYEPYEVTIEWDGGEVMEAECTCPYDWGGYCKHIVAALLAYLRQPDRVTRRPAVANLLADLERDQVLDLLNKLLADHPRLVDWVEAQLAVRTTPVEEKTSAPPSPRQMPLDPAPFRRQAHSILGSLRGMRASEAYWHTGSIVQQMQELLNQALPFIEAGDGQNALLLLEAITEPYVDRWAEFDDSDGELGGLFADMGALFAEAILSADLSPEERQAWATKLTKWQNEIEDYGIDEAFDVAIAAAEQGWDNAPLQKVLQGHISNQGAWAGEAPWYADDLAVARLNVLERQGRTSEYLYLAEAEGQTTLYLTMLVKLGRSQEAVEYARQHMTTPDEALALAQALREHNHHADALKIAEQGLLLQGETLHLARWLRDFAVQVGQSDLALRAAQVTFERSPSLAEYQMVETIAGAAWPSVKVELLKQLASMAYAGGKIDIYLHEEMVDEAIKTVNRSSYVGYEALERVVDAAKQSHPDWAIQQSRKQAEEIMDGGKSQHYHHAIRWLEKACQAYLAAGRTQEWSSYLEDLITKHTRKYSLRPQLEKLRK